MYIMLLFEALIISIFYIIYDIYMNSSCLNYEIDWVDLLFKP